jgi:hypothetical protein
VIIAESDALSMHARVIASPVRDEFSMSTCVREGIGDVTDRPSPPLRFHNA